MPFAERQHDGNTHTFDNANGVASVAYIVYELQRGIDEPTDYLPQPGSPHPDAPLAARGMRIDSGEVMTWFDNSTALCRVNCSTDGRGRLRPEIPIDDPTFEDWAFTSSRTTIRVPRYVRKVHIIPPNAQAGTAASLTYIWDPEPWDEPTREFGLVRTVNVQTFGSSDLTAIESRQGQLHSFFGRLWRFESGESRLVAKDVWQLQYNWVRPAPVPSFGNGPGYPVVKDADGVPFSTLDIIVPPFELQPFDEYGVLPGATADLPPQIVAEQRGDRTNLSGHIGLPGNPI